VTTTEVIDPDLLQGWLSEAIGQPIERVDLELLPQGHANGAWHIVAETADGPRQMVLKASRIPSIVHDLHPCREAHVVDVLGRAGAPVPMVVAIDPGTSAIGRPCSTERSCDHGRREHRDHLRRVRSAGLVARTPNRPRARAPRFCSDRRRGCTRSGRGCSRGSNATQSELCDRLPVTTQ